MRQPTWLLLLLFVFISSNIMAQENNAILCADGIDNDGDGLIDCEDIECQSVPNMGCATCFQDGLSFVDYVISYDPECFDDLDPTLVDPEVIVGLADFSPTPNEPYGIGRVTLGEGGSITVGFSDNVVTNSGDNSPDVWVFEVGFDVEGTMTDFRPLDANTENILIAQGVPDADGDGFYELGSIGGATSSVDLDAIVTGQAFGTLRFDAIKLTDIMDFPCGAASAGADIDAVCALSSLPAEICDDGIDNDNDGFVDCDDPDLENNCCCIEPEDFDLPSNLIFCDGVDIILDAGSGWLAYFWSTGDTTQTTEVNEQGDYTITVIDSCGNFLDDTISVVINAAFEEVIDLNLCSGDIEVIAGDTISEAGIYEYEFQTSEGCDSILIVEVEVGATYEFTYDFYICQGDVLEFGNETYESSGTYVQELLSTMGCDSTLTINLEVEPPFEVVDTVSICEGEFIDFFGEELSASGTYMNTVTTGLCDSTYVLDLTVNPVTMGSIDITLCGNEEIEINGETFNESGNYQQTLINEAGCDSLLDIIIRLSSKALVVDFNACQSTIVDGANGSYQEFESVIIEEAIDCGTISSSVVYRNNPEINIHSCTPGVDETRAMCVGSLDNCDYDPGNEKSIIFEVTLDPEPGETLTLSCLEFYEKAPEMFDWFGVTGPNNYPNLFAVRVLRAGTEIYRLQDIQTQQEWNLRSFSFENNSEFTVSTETTFEIQLLGYCTEVIGSTVNAWDIDELSVSVSCTPTSGNISGRITTNQEEALENVLVTNQGINLDYTATADWGSEGFTLPSTPFYYDYFVTAFKNDDPLNGVSTLDLITMQKHILGLKTFERFDQYIAADINKSDSVSAIDLIELRKLILGIHSEFTNNTSWRFADQSLVPELSNPFDIHEFIKLDKLNSDLDHQDFVAIKIGDLNGSAFANVNATSIENRTNNSLAFEWISTDAGMSLVAMENVSLQGIQFSLVNNELDAELINGVLSNVILENLDNHCRLVWYNAVGQDISEGDVLFTLKNAENVPVFSDELHAEAYIDNGFEVEVYNIETVSKSAELNSEISSLPNPFIEETTLFVNSLKEGMSELRIFSMDGKQVFNRREYVTSGMNQTIFSGQGLENYKGILIAEWITPDAKRHQVKLIKY